MRTSKPGSILHRHSVHALTCLSQPANSWLTPNYMSLVKPHPILISCASNFFEVHKACLTLKMLTGRYLTEMLQISLETACLYRTEHTRYLLRFCQIGPSLFLSPPLLQSIICVCVCVYVVSHHFLQFESV